MDTPSSRTRSSTPALALGLLAAFAVVAVLFAVADRAFDGRRSRGERPDREAIAAELAAVSRALPPLMDSTRRRLVSADHFRLWLDARETAGSSQLMSILQLLLTMPELEWTELLTRVGRGDPVLEGLGSAQERRALLRHVRLQESLEGNPTGWLAPILDQELSPGAWRYVFQRDEEVLPVDFRATGRALAESGFVGEMRRAVRDLERHLATLEALQAVNDSLRAGMRPGDRATDGEEDVP